MIITLLSGSPRKNSLTQRAALFLQKELQAKGHIVHLIDMRETQLNFVQSVWTKHEDVPEAYKAISSAMREAQAIVLVSPEYNGSYSPAMKNLMDHFPKDTYMHKAMGIVTASTGAFGGMRAAQQMQQLICAFFGIPSPHMMVVPDVEHKFDADGNLTDEKFRASADRFLNEFLWLAEKLAATH